MREAERQQRDAESQAQVLGALGEGADDDFGRGAVRTTFSEVMFDEPGLMEAESVAELHLLEHLAVRALLAHPLPVRMWCVPGPRCVDLVQQIQFHRSPRSGLRDADARWIVRDGLYIM